MMQSTTSSNRPFLETAEEKNTSPEIMQAIFELADEDEQTAERIWDDPTWPEVQRIRAMVSFYDEEDYENSIYPFEFQWDGDTNWYTEEWT